MGFAPTPPRPTVSAVLEGVDLWSQRAELAIFHEDLPWADLLAGMPPADILQRDKVQLTQYMRDRGLALTFVLDLTNGLAREEEAAALVEAGRSLTEPAVQQLALDYALAVESELAPDWMGVAAETNLVRAVAPAPLYAALVETAASIDAALQAANARSQRFISVQAEVAWGRLGGTGPFSGIAQDLADFPFTSALGISSYPYFGWNDAQDIPDDYYSRLRGMSNLPVIVTEGGWTSAAAGSIASSPEKQASYIARHGQLLASVNAIAYFQLLFSDLDLDSFPQPVPANLPLFAQIGLTDTEFSPKPSLAEWDALFGQPLA